MKIIILFLIFTVSITIQAEIKDTVMIKINSKSDISKIDLEMLNTSLEISLTKLDYGIISKEVQEEALKKQKEQRKTDCYDEECLVDTGRMLAARELLILDIKVREKGFFIKFKRVDIETAIILKSDIVVIDKEYKEENIHKKLSEVINTLFKKDKEANTSSFKKVDIIINTNMVFIKNKENNALLKIDGEKVQLEKNSYFYSFNTEKTLSKGMHKIEIECKYFEKIDRIIDTSKKDVFEFDLKLKPYTIEIVSEPKNLVLKYYDSKNQLKTKKTPFKLKINSKNRTMNFYIAKINKYEYFEKEIDPSKPKIIIKLKDLKKADLEQHQSLTFISEYTYSEPLKNNYNLGLIFDLNNMIKRNTIELSGFSVGLSGDFYNKTLTTKLSLFPAKLLINLNRYSLIYIQVGLAGFGDYVDILFKDGDLYFRGFASFKIGLQLRHNYPIFNSKIYFKVASEYKRKGLEYEAVVFGIGINLEYNFLD